MASQHQQPLGLPPTLNPDALDTLSDLAILLTRLRAGISSSSNTTTSSAINPTSSTANNPSSAATGPPLALKDLPSHSDQLRHRFQKARALMRTLPDMERSTAEQEAEIRELEAKIARQKETLEKLKALGGRFAEMGREEGDRMEE